MSRLSNLIKNMGIESLLDPVPAEIPIEEQEIQQLQNDIDQQKHSNLVDTSAVASSVVQSIESAKEFLNKAFESNRLDARILNLVEIEVSSAVSVVPGNKFKFSNLNFESDSVVTSYNNALKNICAYEKAWTNINLSIKESLESRK